METDLQCIEELHKEIEIKRQELNLMLYNINKYYCDCILEKSKELDKLIIEYNKIKEG